MTLHPPEVATASVTQSLAPMGASTAITAEDLREDTAWAFQKEHHHQNLLEIINEMVAALT